MYNGNWRQVATGNPGQVTMLAGAWSTYFDASGLGFEGLPWDGWAIANGNNGTMNLTNKFVVPGYRCDGWGLWVTNVDGYDAYTGGRNQFVLEIYNLPYMSVSLNTQDGFAYNGGAFGVTSPGNNPQGGSIGMWNYVVAGTGDQIPISLIPPYVAMGFAQFVGYTS
jgi:hypothetical protein